MEIEMYARVRGRESSSMIQNLRSVNREKYDYSEFLKRFAASHEDMKVSDDEFDYIYYTYGLSMYGRMPLIEPLEYRDSSKIHDFVIVVDTSGSVAGDKVQTFILKTYNILKERDSFASGVNIHIIQCDSEIQSDTVITSTEDMDRYLSEMEIRGLGGTDFRPVFRYVDDLNSQGHFSDLRGLIYFTDGLGTYPDKMPDYRTAFIFVDDGYSIPEVPAWAMKVVLRTEDIQE
jgi:predicted metal-dependent peptidase